LVSIVPAANHDPRDGRSPEKQQQQWGTAETKKKKKKKKT